MNLAVWADFQVIDESDDWLVVNKPAPLIVHPANRQAEPTLLCGVECLLAFECANGARPAIVNRLDRETSGLVIIAKHAKAARELGMLFEHRQVKKEYVALVHGWPEADGWTVDAPITRAGMVGSSAIWVRQIVHPDGKECLTRFQVEACFERVEGRFTQIRCFPETGRMHQIRVHLAHSGHPIVGDKIYSGDGSEYLEWMAHGWTTDLASRLALPRHALHAAKLEMCWHGVSLSWNAPLPDDLATFVEDRKSVTQPAIVIWNREP
jgi:23S rRNA pseudouridine1911/1915/1917 synthase